jgi:thiosulfate dehydrogenase
MLLLAVTVVVFSKLLTGPKVAKEVFPREVDSVWIAPSLYTDQVTKGEQRAMVMYGKELVVHTARYLGPKGSVKQNTNGMNCQNCHLNAGTRPFGNNYGAVFATYPKFRERSGTTESIYKRVNDCIERSLNGQPLDSNSREMKAIYAYLKWLGQDVPRGQKPAGSGLEKLPYLDRSADPVKGRLVYDRRCVSCHGPNGEGQLLLDSVEYATPPLWGNSSYSDGAGLYRLSNFASYVKNNMPFNQATHKTPALSLEEAWDVAAFINSQPRPHKKQDGDWPDLSKKPVDFPFAPYADTFPEWQHKYGPYQPIVQQRKR